MRRERIHPQSVATSAQAAARLADTRAADNFRNLFELPVLFYVALVVADARRTGDAAARWRWPGPSSSCASLHSLIQCSYNKVMHRFAAYRRRRARAVGVVGRAGGRSAARMSDERRDELELRRLRWRCRRGMRELDQLLERYLDRALEAGFRGRARRFPTAAGNCEDDRLWRWFLGYDPADDAELQTLVDASASLPPLRVASEWRPSRWLSVALRALGLLAGLAVLAIGDAAGCSHPAGVARTGLRRLAGAP